MIIYFFSIKHLPYIKITFMRIFYNVGTGLFSVEKIYDNFIVYDCGGQSMCKITKAIIRAFKKRDIIEAVFISHYDKDHINGLHFLLQYCQVKRLILPMMSDSTKIYYLVSEEYDENEINFILDPQEYIDKLDINTSIHYVDYPNNEIYHPNNIPEDFNDLESKRLKFIPSGVQLKISKKYNWVYIPWNIKTLTQIEEDHFMKELKKLIFNDVNYKIDNIKTLWEEYQLCDKNNNIKKAIQKLIGTASKTINAMSQTLYSGPIIDYKNCICKNGCLYLGDFDAKQNFAPLFNIYKEVWNEIKIIQIPHHGSPNNFNKNLIKRNIVAIISASINPIYKVNPKEVVNLLEKHNILPRITGTEGDIKIKGCPYI